MENSNPYKTLPNRAFWKLGSVVEKTNGALHHSTIYEPSRTLSGDDKIVSVGSCFANEITEYIKRVSIIGRDFELVQLHIVNSSIGNVYTTTQFKQLLEWALLSKKAPEKFWKSPTGWVNPYFQDQEYPTLEALIFDQTERLNTLQKDLSDATVLIFTLGLTEEWIFDGNSCLVAPQVRHQILDSDAGNCYFRKLSLEQMIDDLEAIEQLLYQLTAITSVIYTVSPVPLTATATGRHILPENEISKASLRVLASHFAEDAESRADYFPSYEIVKNHRYASSFFKKNMRNVTDDAIDIVMRSFFHAHGYEVTKNDGDQAKQQIPCLETNVEAVLDRNTEEQPTLFCPPNCFFLGQSHLGRMIQSLTTQVNQQQIIPMGAFWHDFGFAINNDYSDYHNLANDFLESGAHSSNRLIVDFLFVPHIDIQFVITSLSQQFANFEKQAQRRMSDSEQVEVVSTQKEIFESGFRERIQMKFDYLQTFRYDLMIVVPPFFPSVFFDETSFKMTFPPKTPYLGNSTVIDYIIDTYVQVATMFIENHRNVFIGKIERTSIFNQMNLCSGDGVHASETHYYELAKSLHKRLTP